MMDMNNGVYNPTGSIFYSGTGYTTTSGPPTFFTTTGALPMTTTTIRVTNASCFREFDGPTAEQDALEYARELAHSSNQTVYLQRVYKVVKPKREVTEEDVTS